MGYEIWDKCRDDMLGVLVELTLNVTPSWDVSMTVNDVLQSKDLKPKQKTELISKWILDNAISVREFIEVAARQKDPAKAMCIEAMEFSSRQDPKIADEAVLKFVTDALTEKSPSIKRESARVIGNIAHRFPSQLEQAVINLLINAEHNGTVVRWSAAFALGEIVKLNTTLNQQLLPAIEAICEKEEKNSIRKIYQAAIKKVK